MNRVKKVFFESDSPYPSFIMESGGTKRPHRIGERVAWFTDKEMKDYAQPIYDKSKEEIKETSEKYEKTGSSFSWFRKLLNR